MTLRKLLACCIAGTVVAAVGMFLAVVHAGQHPDSSFGRVATAAYRTVVGSNPLFLVGHTCRGDEPGTCCGCATGTAIVMGDRPSGRLDLQKEPEFLPPVFVNDFSAGVAVELISPPTVSEEEEFGIEIGLQQPVTTQRFLPIMPRAADDAAPAIMPHADDASPDEGLISFWTRFLGGHILLLDGCREKDGWFRNYDLPPYYQETPYYHLLYPAYPYTCPESRNYCPYTGQRIDFYTPPDHSAEAVRFQIQLKSSAEDETPPRHSDVDTMEFRPQDDAGPSSFGRISF